MKSCGSCKEEKDFSHFYKNRVKSSGYSSYCKDCERAKLNTNKNRLKSKRFYENNKDYCFSKTAAYRAKKLQAQPSWLTEEMKEEIKLKYRQSLEIGGCHVDHIVPLQGKNVCGLHVPWNLQILTAAENLQKSNREAYDQSS